jgi:hypothetical protein
MENNRLGRRRVITQLGVSLAAAGTLGRGESVDPSSYYFRTVPRFETSTQKYAFLNRIIAVGVGETRPDGAVHRIDEIL